MSKKMAWRILCCLMVIAPASVHAFHPDIYVPRVPAELIEKIQDQDNPYRPTPERIEKGREVYFGKGLCVTCHSKDGRGVKLPGHSPRDFTDAKWQDLRTDGEMMWVLKNGSPGTGMPVRVGKDINEEEGWSVIHFIRTFKKR
ncbi:MAG: cytochrome c [Candidatus Nitrohelix vancouverensis]|uniref:Cytochrome c n=1 Tax=Candidatus Nitrohelix vancouverensis TaxID=2705534 RepID=A0A7T0G247_9BACT|nr:MAG: cytochrome c [Candidatus Nitrohelix vancouverensis]